ncbi:MAG: hypothetical protein F6J87_07570 [Spirulina sp. SIO3F2]|nr:hypothetical protein [Spirulina sp. SIO3F2]
MNRSSVTPVLAVIWISLLAGCQFINSINPFAAEETPPPQPVAGAPANPNAPPADPNAAGAPADPNAPPAGPNAAPAQAPASVPNVPQSQTPFRDAVNKAMSTAEAVQTAKSVEEWQAVVTGWQEAIALMQQVPAGDTNHATAQAKVTEYTGYLDYAKANAGQ